MKRERDYIGYELDATEGLRVYDLHGKETKVYGQYEIIDYECEDRDAGIFGSYFSLMPVGTSDLDEGWETEVVTADPYDVLAVIDPEGIARIEAQELAWEDDMAAQYQQEQEIDAEYKARGL